MIFYFSATGNSLWAARLLGQHFDMTPVSVADAMKKGECRFDLARSPFVMFVFPVHSWGPAVTMLKFVERMELEAPQDWQDLLKSEYEGLIWLSNYNTAGTAKLVINTMIQKYGHDEGIQYLVDLDKNIQVYTKSGSGPSKNVGTGECVIGIGFLHDGITQIIDNGYTNIELIIPSSGTSFEIGATAIFKGAAHPNAAKLWIEFALSPDCVNIAKDNGSYQFLVIDNAEQPEQAAEFGLDPENVMDYDFEDATNNITTYVEEVMNALGGGDDRFQTE